MKVLSSQGSYGYGKLGLDFRRGRLRDGDHIYGWQQLRKLPNAFREVVTSNIDSWNFVLRDWNGLTLKPSMSSHWRASLVPAAAVIPAPEVHMKVVAVKQSVADIKAWMPFPCVLVSGS